MTKQKSNQKTNSADAEATKPEAAEELTEEQLDKVDGGNIGSQSSGAGAGKVTFNPF